MARRRPTNPRTHHRDGLCALCGQQAQLTDTHVPPRAAFNSGRVSRSVVEESESGDLLVNDRPRDGGNRVWGHCTTCHHATSAFDEEYVAWANAGAAAIVGLARHERPSDTPIRLLGARPGKFIRAALAGMAAVAESLHQTHPALIAAIRSGNAIEPPVDLRFLAGLTPVSDAARVVGGHRGVLATIPLNGQPVRHPSGLHVTGGWTEHTPSAVIHWPPFSLVLVHADGAARYPHVDQTDWLRESADADPRDVDLAWPTVRWAETFSSLP